MLYWSFTSSVAGLVFRRETCHTPSCARVQDEPNRGHWQISKLNKQQKCPILDGKICYTLYQKLWVSPSYKHHCCEVFTWRQALNLSLRAHVYVFKKFSFRKDPFVIVYTYRASIQRRRSHDFLPCTLIVTVMIYKRRCGWHKDVLFFSNVSTINAFISEIVLHGIWTVVDLLPTETDLPRVQVAFLCLFTLISSVILLYCFACLRTEGVYAVSESWRQVKKRPKQMETKASISEAVRKLVNAAWGCDFGKPAWVSISCSSVLIVAWTCCSVKALVPTVAPTVTFLHSFSSLPFSWTHGEPPLGSFPSPPARSWRCWGSTQN